MMEQLQVRGQVRRREKKNNEQNVELKQKDFYRFICILLNMITQKNSVVIFFPLLFVAYVLESCCLLPCFVFLFYFVFYCIVLHCIALYGIVYFRVNTHTHTQIQHTCERTHTHTHHTHKHTHTWHTHTYAHTYTYNTHKHTHTHIHKHTHTHTNTHTHTHTHTHIHIHTGTHTHIDTHTHTHTHRDTHTDKQTHSTICSRNLVLIKSTDNQCQLVLCFHFFEISFSKCLQKHRNNLIFRFSGITLERFSKKNI